MVEINSKSVFQTTASNTIAQSTEIYENSSIEYLSTYETTSPKGSFQKPDGNFYKMVVGKLPASGFSAYHNIRVKTVSGNQYPPNDIESGRRQDLYKELTIENLVQNKRGASIYKYDDFLYLRDVNKIPLNRLITLRRFNSPVFDDIFSKSSSSEPDIARLLTYSTIEENKFEDILAFSMGLRWKQMSSSSEQGQILGDDKWVTGIVGNVLKFVDPAYGTEALSGGHVYYDPQHDQSKVYGPVDSIADTNIRNIGLDFNQDMKLIFNFEMRSINGINQKMAFIDLLSTIMLMCTNDGKFWGGARYWTGPKPSKYMNMLRGVLHPKSWQDFTAKGEENIKQIWKNNFGSKDSALETLKNIANNALNLALGRMLNTLGRTSIPLMNSLLTGTPVGPWHVTIGNPFNPIMVQGDMIMTSANVKFGNELGYDDFPTELFLEVVMSPGKPRGRAEIESMFNAGKGRTYFKPKNINRNKANNSSAIDPTHASAYSVDYPLNTDNKAYNQKVANLTDDYTSSDYERNSPDVWSFVDNDAPTSINSDSSEEIQVKS